MEQKERLIKTAGMAAGGILGFIFAMKAPVVFVASVGVVGIAVGAGYAAGFGATLTNDVIKERKLVRV